MMSWAAEEFETVKLGDKRLNSLGEAGAATGSQPPSEHSRRVGGWGDTAVAYRLLDNKRCDWREIIRESVSL